MRGLRGVDREALKELQDFGDKEFRAWFWRKYMSAAQRMQGRGNKKPVLYWSVFKNDKFIRKALRDRDHTRCK